MKEENLIHIKLEYLEGLKSKKDLLSSELNLLRIARTIKRYAPLRIEELKAKLKVYRLLKEIRLDIGRLEKSLPKIKTSGIIKKEILKEDAGTAIKRAKSKQYDRSIESQLQEIQDKLLSLQK